MKIKPLFLTFTTFLLSCSPYLYDHPVSLCDRLNGGAIRKWPELEQQLLKLVDVGVPGVSVAVMRGDDLMTYSAGLAKIESMEPMQACHLQYLQSIAKTYVAAGVLKLHEQQRMHVDSVITRYLPSRYHSMIPGVRSITVRMLLNHTSGVPEYNSKPAYVTRLLQDPLHRFTPDDYMQFSASNKSDFAPGTRYSYRNTNYELLAIMMDHVTGDHSRFLDSVFFQPLQLKNTFYRSDPAYMNYPNLVNSYWDRYSDGIVENVSALQKNNVSSMIGDDGIVATPADAVVFLTALLEGRLLSAESLEMMRTLVKDSHGRPEYGLGLDYGLFAGKEGYGHSGGGIGAGAQLYYFPEKDLCFCISINLGTVTGSPIHKRAEPILTVIHEIILSSSVPGS